jgi:nitrite reductase/ring-hydroxylating ferredoxin subunit
MFRTRKSMPSSDDSSQAFDRRSVLACLAALPALRSALARADTDESISYRELREPVELPAPAGIWESVGFKAWLVPRPEDGLSMPLLLLNGFALRVPVEGGTGESAVHAFCRTCPHEICDVDFVADTSHIRIDTGAAPPAHPVFFCVCHESVFDPTRDGAHISGPAPRGLYRFAFDLDGSTLHINSVEEAVLARLGEDL